MTSERDTSRTVEGWLAQPAPKLPDRVINETIDRLPHTPQRRRWWPFRWFPFGIGATRSTGPGGPPSHGRSKIMFSTTHVAAVTAIVALAGSLAIANVTLRPASNPAGAPAAAVGPSAQFTGTQFNGSEEPGVTTTDAGIVQKRGGVLSHRTNSSDSRFSGHGSSTVNSDLYPTETGLLMVAWGTMEIENEDGAWKGTWSGTADPDEPVITTTAWLVGEGAYEGLSASGTYTTDLHRSWKIAGWIFPGDPPSFE